MCHHGLPHVRSVALGALLRIGSDPHLTDRISRRAPHSSAGAHQDKTTDTNALPAVAVPFFQGVPKIKQSPAVAPAELVRVGSLKHAGETLKSSRVFSYR